MPQYIVKQPNKLYGRFSTIVDDYTHLNFSREEMIEVLQFKGCGQTDIDRHLRAADDDEPIYGRRVESDGLDRWRYCLKVVPLNKDEQAVQRVMDDLATGKAMVR